MALGDPKYLDDELRLLNDAVAIISSLHQRFARFENEGYSPTKIVEMCMQDLAECLHRLSSVMQHTEEINSQIHEFYDVQQLYMSLPDIDKFFSI